MLKRGIRYTKRTSSLCTSRLYTDLSEEGPADASCSNVSSQWLGAETLDTVLSARHSDPQKQTQASHTQTSCLSTDRRQGPQSDIRKSRSVTVQNRGAMKHTSRHVYASHRLAIYTTGRDVPSPPAFCAFCTLPAVVVEFRALPKGD